MIKHAILGAEEETTMIDIKAIYMQAHYSHVRFMAERARRLHPEATWNYGMTTVGRLSCCVIERIGRVG